MALQDPKTWTHDAKDMKREEAKREQSPASFFFSQGHALVLAGAYFHNERLTVGSRGGVATKHRHRIRLALFGQLMASLEFLLKDFVAKVVDTVPTFDKDLLKAKRLQVDAARILSMKSAATTAGALLLHPTMGWQDPEEVNKRYESLFSAAPIANEERPVLEELWILRHSVAHNAGFVTAYDAARAGMPHLAGEVADIDQPFLKDSFQFLCQIARRIAEDVGDKVVCRWLKERQLAGRDYSRDKEVYTRLKLLRTYVPSRARELPKMRKSAYTSDFHAAKSGKPAGKKDENSVGG